MSGNSITLTLPLDNGPALSGAAEYLAALAEKAGVHVEGGDDKVTPQAVFSEQADPPPTGMSSGTAEQYEQETDHAEQDAASVFGGKPSAGAAEGQAGAPRATTTAADAMPAGTPEPAPSAAAPAGAELDSDGLPWDARIHASTKKKLAKTKQWKRKRGVSEDYKREVEAELRQAMAAGGAAQSEDSAPAPAPAPASPSPAPAPAPEAAPVAPSPAPAPAPAPSDDKAAPDASAVTTFAELMHFITGNKISQEAIDAAVSNQGVPSLPLLATRPDLIPAVARELAGG